MKKGMNKKKITIIGILILIILLVLWINSRWNAWFRNPEEPPFVSLSVPSRILLTWGNKGEFSRILCWQYDSIPHDARVELITGDDTVFIAAQSHRIVSRGGKSVFYRAELNHLAPGETYYYRILYPGLQPTGSYCFEMPDTTDKKFSFVYFGDVQDTVNGQFPEIIQHISQDYPDAAFYVFGGDQIERPHDQYWDLFLKSIDVVSREKPVLAVTGNHEYVKGLNKKLEERFPSVFPYYLNYPAGSDNCVFTFNYQCAQFFLLDSDKGLLDLYKQKNWLESELKKSNARWKIVVLHHPLYSIRGKYNNYFVRMMFDSVIETNGVDLVLQGHEHGYARKDGKDGKTPVYVISHCSPKEYRHELNDDMKKYVAGGNRFYQVIHIDPYRLKLEAFTGQDSLIDKFSIDSETKLITDGE